MRDNELAALLSGDAVAWRDAGAWTEAAFFRAAEWHGIIPLLASQVAQSGGECPASVVEELQRRGRQHAAQEDRVRDEFIRVLEALSQAGVRPLVFKGTALAYQYYEEPWHRLRTDTDILVPRDQVAVAGEALRALGYEGEPPLRKDAKGRQAVFSRREADRLEHVLDVHWDVMNRPSLAGLLTYDELAQRAEPLPALHESALVPCAADALLLAAVHRVSHHDNAIRLIWLHDIALLMRHLGDEVTTTFRTLAEQKRVSAVCADAVFVAASRWPDLRSVQAWAEAWKADAIGRAEPSAIYLTRKPWRGDVALSDVRALPGWRERVRFLSAVLLPDAPYMRARYGSTRRWTLPGLHVRRLTQGLWRLAARFGRPLSIPRPLGRRLTLPPGARIRVPTGVLVTPHVQGLVLRNLNTDLAHSVDEVGAQFWNVLTEAPSVDHAMTHLQQVFAVDPGTLRSDLGAFVRALEQKGLVSIDAR